MESNFPTLQRPKRKLCYLANSPTKKWTEPLTLADIDKMFDDLDSPCRNNDDILEEPLSPPLQTSDPEAHQSEKGVSPDPQEEIQSDMGPDGDALHPAGWSLSNLVIDLDVPFKAHWPLNTSSPIEQNNVVEGLEGQNGDGQVQVVSPILFACEDEAKEEAKMEKPTPRSSVPDTLEAQAWLDSPPTRISLSKPNGSTHINKVEESSKESRPFNEKASKKPQTAVVEEKRKTQRLDNPDPPIPAVPQEPELTTHKKKSQNVPSQPTAEKSVRAGKDMSLFLQKLRDGVQPKPACPRKSLSPVKVPAPPEPEDDFWILEDDAPMLFSIPRRAAKTPKQSKTSSADMDASKKDKETKEGLSETAWGQREAQRTKDKPASLTETKTKKKGKEKRNDEAAPDVVESCSPDAPPEGDPTGEGEESDFKKKGRRIKKAASKETHEKRQPPEDDTGEETENEKLTAKTQRKGKEKKNDEAAPDVVESCSPDVPPEGDPTDEGEESDFKKKWRRIKKAPSKETQEKRRPPEDDAGEETENEKLTAKTQKKAQGISDTKRSKTSKDGSESAKASRAKTLKEARKLRQESGAVKEAEDVESVSEPSQEHVDTEHMDSIPDEQDIISEAQTDRLAVPSAESPLKRKRRLASSWWLSGKETEAPDIQPTLKKTKRNIDKEPNASAAASPARAQKEKVLKRRSRTPASPTATPHVTKKPKAKKIKESKTREFEGMEGKQQQEEEEQQDDLSSPLVFSHRELSNNSSDQVFQRVYHNSSNDQMPATSAPSSPTGQRARPGAEDPVKRSRRSRKGPGNWWEVDSGTPEEVAAAATVTAEPQQTPKPRPQKEEEEEKKKKKQKPSEQSVASPRLGTPKTGNVNSARATAHPPTVRPLSAPKTVKRSLATFKNIFTSSGETTPAPVRDAGRSARRKVLTPTRPTEELTHDTPQSTSAEGPINGPSSPKENNYRSELHDVRSGPSSMVDVEQYEENEDFILPASRVQSALSLSDLCSPPLRPLKLQPKDEANLAEWFKSLWSTTVDNSPEVTPDQFDWFSYKGRAMGLVSDVNSGSICSGKIMLGSYMKKPLWVDHIATTVFHVLTSTVSVNIDSKDSRFHPGRSFMVPFGHAYSIQNVSAMPAVLYFTRILAEHIDEEPGHVCNN